MQNHGVWELSEGHTVSSPGYTCQVSQHQQCSISDEQQWQGTAYHAVALQLHTYQSHSSSSSSSSSSSTANLAQKHVKHMTHQLNQMHRSRSTSAVCHEHEGSGAPLPVACVLDAMHTCCHKQFQVTSTSHFVLQHAYTCHHSLLLSFYKLATQQHACFDKVSRSTPA